MPTQPNEGGRDLERRASDGLNPENRPENAGRHATRRTVLSMVTGGIAATAVVGTAAASERPTVYASSTTCGLIDLDYTSHGPTVGVSLDGPESYNVTLEPGGSDEVPVVPGEYDVQAHPENANGGSSVPVEGSPVNAGCVDATFEGCVSGMFYNVNVANNGGTCVHLEIVLKRSGRVVDSKQGAIGSKDSWTPTLYFWGADEWIYRAYSPTATGDCKVKSDETVPINGEPLLRLKGTDCDSLEVLEGELKKFP